MKIVTVKHNLNRTISGSNVNPINLTLVSSIELEGGKASLVDVTLASSTKKILITLKESSAGTNHLLFTRSFDVHLNDPATNWIGDIDIVFKDGNTNKSHTSHQESGDEGEKPGK